MWNFCYSEKGRLFIRQIEAVEILFFGYNPSNFKFLREEAVKFLFFRSRVLSKFRLLSNRRRRRFSIFRLFFGKTNPSTYCFRLFSERRNFQHSIFRLFWIEEAVDFLFFNFFGQKKPSIFYFSTFFGEKKSVHFLFFDFYRQKKPSTFYFRHFPDKRSRCKTARTFISDCCSRRRSKNAMVSCLVNFVSYLQSVSASFLI